MKSFNLGALRQWEQVGVGELLDFPCPDQGSRAVQFDLIADGHVSVRVVSGENAWLVAAGVGQMVVKFSIDDNVGVTVLGEPDTDVFIRTHVDNHVIPTSDDPTFTTIEPRQAGPSDELRQMMHLVNLNTQRREAAYRAEMDALRQQVEAAKQASPAPAPAPSDGEVIEAKE